MQHGMVMYIYAGMQGCSLVSCSNEGMCMLEPQLCLSGDSIAANRRAYQAKSFEYYVDCTYVELFNESCSDLLRPGMTPCNSLCL